MSEQTEIVRLFSEEINRELTINQISKLIKKSYAFTNKQIHILIANDILKRKIIGSAILCSLNYKSERAIAMLVMCSVDKKINFENSMKHNDKEKLRAFLESLSSSSNSQQIKTIYSAESGLFIVCNDKFAFDTIDLKLSGFKITVLDDKEFSNSLRKNNISKITVMKNHESFWQELGKLNLGFR